jgi:hypothetical protein
LSKAKVATTGKAPKRKRANQRAYPRIPDWIWLAIFALSVSVIGALFYIKWHSEVDLDLTVSRLSLQVSNTEIGSLFNSARTTSLTLSNFKSLDLGGGTLENANDVNPTTGDGENWQPMVRMNDRGQNTIIPTRPYAPTSLTDVTLNSVTLKEGSQIVLESSGDEPRSIKVSLSRGASGEISAGRVLSLSCDYCQVEGGIAGPPSKILRLTAADGEGQVIKFSGGDDVMVIGLSLKPGVILQEQSIAIGKDVGFTRLQGERLLSTIITGKIRVDGIKDDIPLERGDFVNVSNSDNLTIKSIQTEKDNPGIKVSLHGSFRKLEKGADPNSGMKDIIPVLLKRLHGSEWVTLLMFSISAVFSVIKEIREILK